MKELKLLMLVLVGLAFVGCSDDNVVDDNGKGTLVGDEAWMSISVTPGTTGSRSLHNPDEEENGKPNESKINTLRVILFDGFTDAAKVTNVVDIATGVTENNPVSAFKVSTKAQSVLAIINPTSRMASVVAGNTYAQVNSAINASVADVIGSSENDFMMTNATGKLEPQVAPSGSDNKAPYVVASPTYLKDNHLKPTEIDAKGAALPIIVDRVVAKVRVYNQYTNPSGTPGSAADIPFVIGEESPNVSSFKWALNVTNRRFFPISARTYTQRELNYKKGLPNHATTKFVWSDEGRFGSYRIDPNYNTSTTPNQQPVIASTADAATDANYRASYRFFDEGGTANDGSTIIWHITSSATGGSDVPEAGDTKSPQEYCLENTQDADGNLHAYTTHVLIQAKVYPSHFVQANGTLQAATANPNFFKIDKGYYTFATLKENVAAEMRDYINYNTSPSLTNVFNSYLIFIGLNEIKYQEVIDGESGDIDAKVQAVTNLYDSTLENDIALHGSDTDGFVTYYKESVSYYKIMIKHDNEDANDFMNKLGEFGVVRNSVYDILVNGVNAPGYPKIPQPDPEDEDEELENWLSIQIKINPWTWYTQTAVLE